MDGGRQARREEEKRRKEEVDDLAQRKRKGRADELARGNCFRVIVVVKPAKDGSPMTLSIHDQAVTVTRLHHPLTLTVDHVFDVGVNLSRVHDYLVQSTSVQNLIHGRTAMVLAYGRTGTGKTRLISQGDGDQVCLVHSMLAGYKSQLISICEADTCEVEVQATEVYANHATHVFGPDKPHPDSKATVSIDGTIRNPQPRNISTDAQLSQAIKDLNDKRATRAMIQNPTGSSRSHLILACTLKCGLNTARLVFVDLAGTESDASPACTSMTPKKSSAHKCTPEDESKHISSDLEELRRNVVNLSQGAVYSAKRTLSKVLRPYMKCADVTYIGTVAADGDPKETKSTLEHLAVANEVRRYAPKKGG